MAHKLRVEYSGAIYHVMNRDNRWEPIFKSEEDRELFLETLGEACAKTGWLVHASVLMSNHFHRVVETPQPNLVAGMKWFDGVKITLRLRAETVMTVAWINDRPHRPLESRNYANHLLATER